MTDTSERHDPIEHFNERASEWTDLYARPQFRDRLNLFARNVQELAPNNAEILDYGCGSGIIALELAKLGFNVNGVDGAKGMVDQALMEAETRNIKNINFECIDHLIWHPNKQYDVIVCSSVLEYVLDDESLLSCFSQWLKHGAWLLISIPMEPSLLGFIEDTSQKLLGRKRDVEFAQRRYKRSQFSQRLEKLDLVPLKWIGFDFPIFGKFGVMLSRIPSFGLMSLVIAQKTLVNQNHNLD